MPYNAPDEGADAVHPGVECLVVLTGPAWAQSPTFEVASVKPNPSGIGSPQRVGLQAGDRVTMVNVPLLTIIQAAHALPPWRVSGGPGWIRAEHFDINAKAESVSSVVELQAMLRALLAERFKLTTHTETKEAQVYSLTLARSDGRLGPRLRRVEMDCKSLAAADPSNQNPCKVNPNLGLGRTAATGYAMANFVAGLGAVLQAPVVVDETGLAGWFEWDLSFTPPNFQTGNFDRSRFPMIDPDGPSIFTAVEEQLGLKLEGRKGPVEFLVIDSVERPTPD